MKFRRVHGWMLLALALAGCGGGSQQGPQAVSVDVAAAKRQTIATSIDLDGQITPLEQATLSFQQSGPIQSINVNVGDRVHAGELLAQIDPSTLRAQLAQAEATARGSQIGLPVAQTSNVSALATAKAAFDSARLVYQQNQQLFKQGYVSEQQLENARAAYVQAQSQYNAASAGIQNTAVSAQNVKALQAAAQVLRTELGQTSLYAPFDGIVTSRTMDPGAMAGPSAPVLSVARVDFVWININVPDEDIAYVHPGSTVTFTTSTLPGKNFAGRVNTVNTVPTQGTLSYLARIYQPNPGEILRGGMLVTANVPEARHENAIVVPRNAIGQDQNGTTVFIVENGKAVQVPVTLGLQTDTLSEVISPKITAGTQVITTRPDALQNGSAVAISNAPTQNNAPTQTGGNK